MKMNRWDEVTSGLPKKIEKPTADMLVFVSVTDA